MKNFNDIIVDAGRVKNFPKGRVKELQGDWEALPDREPMRRRDCGYLYQRDHLSPLLRWLRSQCGRLWNKVYSDLCKAHPKRTIDRYHALTQHADAYVERYPDFKDKVPYHPTAAGYSRRHSWPVRNLYVDQHGILRDNSEVYRKLTTYAPKVDNYYFKDGDVDVFITEDGRMFRKDYSKAYPLAGQQCSYLVRNKAGDPFELIHSSEFVPVPVSWGRGPLYASGPFVAVYGVRRKSA